MDRQTNNFLSVLGYAVHPEMKIELSEPDPEEIFEIAKRHNLYALTAEVLPSLPQLSGFRLSKERFAETVGIVFAQANRTNNFLALYRRLSENGVFPLVVKGIVCRELYGRYSDYRPSSDEDILIRKCDFEKLREVFKACGFVQTADTDFEKQDYQQEVSFHNEKSGLHIEVHLNPFGTRNPLNDKMNSFFRDSFDQSITAEICGTEIHTMNHTDHLLFLIFHAFKHFMFRGFGIRMVLDILLYCEKYGDNCDFDYILSALKQTKAELFFSDLIHIGNRYLGFSLKPFGEPNCPDVLLEDMMNSGIFGGKSDAGKIGGLLAWSALRDFGSEKKHGKIYWIFRTAFPGKSWLYSVNPEIRRKPWLALGAYASRIKKGIRFYRSRKKGLAGDGMKKGEERVELLKKYGVI